MPGPTHGVRVLDLTGVVSARSRPCFWQTKAADVPQDRADRRRHHPPQPRHHRQGSGSSPAFISSNRGKRSLSIDVKRVRSAARSSPSSSRKLTC